MHALRECDQSGGRSEWPHPYWWNTKGGMPHLNRWFHSSQFVALCNGPFILPWGYNSTMGGRCEHHYQQLDQKPRAHVKWLTLLQHQCPCCRALCGQVPSKTWHPCLVKAEHLPQSLSDHQFVDYSLLTPDTIYSCRWLRSQETHLWCLLFQKVTALKNILHSNILWN